MNHRYYFREYEISIEQYGVLLVRLAFRGKNTQHGNKGFDVDKAIINGKCGYRIEVKSKVTHSLGGYKASVIHCSDNKFVDNGMTHLAVVLVNPDSYEVEHAWLITKNQANKLRNRRQYFYVNELHDRFSKKNYIITSKLNTIAMKIIKWRIKK